ncbi:MAG: phosphohydrolase, partial [Candidatus Eremiobacteraeota bacterium]|nr:phosphohydrolase [Candidatus Eremiobacteraeota bacterium]
EVDGANAARTLLEKHAVAPERIDLAWDAIALHDSGGIARFKQPEVRLVNAGVAADFGANLDRLGRYDVVAVLQAAPRTNFIPAFLAAVAEVARRKPDACGNCFVVDVGYRMVPNFHLSNFCDEVKEDPFESFV